MSFKLPHLNNFKRLDLECIIDLEDDLQLAINTKKSRNLISEKPSKKSNYIASVRSANHNHNLNSQGSPTDLSVNPIQNLRMTPNNLSQMFSHYPKQSGPQHFHSGFNSQDDQIDNGVESLYPMLSSKKYFLPSISIYSVPKIAPANFLPTNKLGQNKKIKNVRQFLGDVSPRRRDISPKLLSPMRYVTDISPRKAMNTIINQEKTLPGDHIRGKPILVKAINLENNLNEFTDFHINYDIQQLF